MRSISLLLQSEYFSHACKAALIYAIAYTFDLFSQWLLSMHGTNLWLHTTYVSVLLVPLCAYLFLFLCCFEVELRAEKTREERNVAVEDRFADTLRRFGAVSARRSVLLLSQSFRKLYPILVVSSFIVVYCLSDKPPVLDWAESRCLELPATARALDGLGGPTFQPDVPSRLDDEFTEQCKAFLKLHQTCSFIADETHSDEHKAFIERSISKSDVILPPAVAGLREPLRPHRRFCSIPEANTLPLYTFNQCSGIFYVSCSEMIITPEFDKVSKARKTVAFDSLLVTI